MNIFVLSKNARKCAKYHCNKHVVKMILESAQLLCCAHIVLDNSTVIGTVELYKLTHKNHPCSIWVRASSANYKWLYQLFIHLCEEYTHRYGKTHLCEQKFKDVLCNVPVNITVGPMTPWAQAMPEEYKSEDPVESYRTYYINDKADMCVWTRRETPYWVPVGEECE